jgi:hypothetical protein
LAAEREGLADVPTNPRINTDPRLLRSAHALRAGYAARWASYRP